MEYELIDPAPIDRLDDDEDDEAECLDQAVAIPEEEQV